MMSFFPGGSLVPNSLAIFFSGPIAGAPRSQPNDRGETESLLLVQIALVSPSKHRESRLVYALIFS